MVDNLNDEIGRLLDFLRENGLFDDTVIVFVSDNGAANLDFYNAGPAMFTTYIRANLTIRTSHGHGGIIRFVRHALGRGRIRTFRQAQDVHWRRRHCGADDHRGPDVAGSDVIARQYVTVMDLAPTFLEIAGASYPDDGSVRPMLGESVMLFLNGEADRVHDDEYVTLLSHWGRTFIRQGYWKMLTLEGPFDESKFELFDPAEDPGGRPPTCGNPNRKNTRVCCRYGGRRDRSTASSCRRISSPQATVRGTRA